MKFINALGEEYRPTNFLTYDDVLLVPQYSDILSRKCPSINLSTGIAKIPLISANMDTVTGSKMAIAMHQSGGLGILHRFYKNDKEWEQEVLETYKSTGKVVLSIGGKKENLDSIKQIREWGLKQVAVCIDIAHGHLQLMIDQINRISDTFPGYTIIAGNVCTPQAALRLAQEGAGIIKISIGSGSLCTTRRQTGFGVPTLTAIMQCREILDDNGLCEIALISDGGIKNSGDIVKSLAAGADAVMIGNLFAGTDETPGEVIDKGSFEMVSHFGNGEWKYKTSPYKKYRGQASQDFMNDHGKEGVAAEGEHTLVPCKGPVKSIIENLVGGIRSGMSYAGARTIQELRDRAVFIEVGHHAYVESLPHGKLANTNQCH